MENSLSSWLSNFHKAKILCIGDLILDRFVYGETNRISPEAPIPVLEKSGEEVMLGGAGNVFRNVTSLTGQCNFISVIGDDDAGRALKQILGKEKNAIVHLPVEQDRKTPEKIRYIAGSNQQLLRVDNETRTKISAKTEQQIIKYIEEAAPKNDVVVLSDYAKGVLTPAVIAAAVAAAKKAVIPLIVDPKSKDFSKYKGADFITPNSKELAAATGSKIKSEEIIVAKKIMAAHDIGNILLTMGKDGMMLIPGKAEPKTFPANAREVFDVSGAGDTVVATLAMGLAVKAPIEEAAELANLAAGIVVGKKGTATVTKKELNKFVISVNNTKIVDDEDLLAIVESWRKDGKKIGFTNGCFDLLHPGHISLISQAGNQCDALIVAINSDESVKRLGKGDDRPLQTEFARATVMASLGDVDAVVIFTEDTPERLLKMIKPDVLVKGADYTKDKVVGAEFVESYGGEIYLAPIQKGHSTTNIAEKARKKTAV